MIFANSWCNLLFLFLFFQEIRGICDQFSDLGLPNFPSGVPFTFYEQYINLRFYLMLSVLCVLLVSLVVLTVVLMNPWLALIVVSRNYMIQVKISDTAVFMPF